MDKILLGKKAESDTSGKVETDDVEMEESKRNSPSRTTEPDEAEEELAENPRPDSLHEDGEDLCTICGFSAKCPRSLKIHYARKHGKNSKNSDKTVEPSAKSENICDDSIGENQQEADMETVSGSEVKQNQESDLLELRSAPNDNGMNTKTLSKKQRVEDKQQSDQGDVIPTQERRVSKRTPKPKMIYSCNYCGQEFRDKAPLEIHVQRYHTKDTPYTCEYLRMQVVFG